MKKTPSPQLEALLNSYMAELVILIHKHLPNSAIYLFGSRARKDYHEGADIDIAIDATTPISIETLCELYNGIEETNIPVSVDFVDLNRTSPDLVKIVKKEGIIWNSQR